MTLDTLDTTFSIFECVDNFPCSQVYLCQLPLRVADNYISKQKSMKKGVYVEVRSVSGEGEYKWGGEGCKWGGEGCKWGGGGV